MCVCVSVCLCVCLSVCLSAAAIFGLPSGIVIPYCSSMMFRLTFRLIKCFFKDCQNCLYFSSNWEIALSTCYISWGQRGAWKRILGHKCLSIFPNANPYRKRKLAHSWNSPKHRENKKQRKTNSLLKQVKQDRIDSVFTVDIPWHIVLVWSTSYAGGSK